MKNSSKYSEITVDDIIKQIISIKEITGKVPQRRDFEADYVYIIRKRFGSFGNAIKAAGFKPRRVERATPEELLSSLHAYYAKYGKSPSISTKDELLYHFSVYYKVLGCNGWSEVLKLAGLPIYITTRKHLPLRPDEIIVYAKNLIEEESIKSIDLLLRNPRFHGIDRINRIFGDKYKFGKLIGLEVNNYDIPFEDVKDKILAAYNELERSPSMSELESRGMSEQYLKRKFGSYNFLLEKVGLTPYAVKPDKCDLSNSELVELYKKISQNNGFENGCGVRSIKQLSGIGADVFIARFGSINSLRSICGYKRERANRPSWSYEDIEFLFREKTKLYGTRITQSIVKSDNDFPSITTIRRYIRCSFVEFTEQIYRSLIL